MSGPVCTYDFTLKSEGISYVELKTFLAEFCKKWCFQMERAESGYLHYQGRISLMMKDRKNGVLAKFATKGWAHVQLSPTSNENRDNCFYVTKQDSRVEGPWMDTDIQLPKHTEAMVPWEWQNQVAETSPDGSKPDGPRKINVLCEVMGNIGKSDLIEYLCTRKKARYLPGTLKQANDMLQWVMSFPESPMYLIDLPRAMNQTKLRDLYVALEVLKGGYCYDPRYTGRERWFYRRPTIWVFCNTMPDTRFLTADKWAFWEVVDKKLREVTVE